MSPYDLLAEVTGLRWYEVREAVTPRSGPVAGAYSPAKRNLGVVYPKGLEPLSGRYSGYLRGRGFDPDSIASLWGVQATGPVGRLSWRLWIPITLDGRVVSWTTRAIGEGVEPRYVSAAPEQEELNHKELLYGQDLVNQSVVIVEGPCDVWAVGPGAVAILGLMTTPKQIERLGRYPVRAICTDAEPAALRRAERLADVLQQFPGTTDVIELETGSDPAEAEVGEIDEIRRRYLD
jgi:DNA primase